MFKKQLGKQSLAKSKELREMAAALIALSSLLTRLESSLELNHLWWILLWEDLSYAKGAQWDVAPDLWALPFYVQKN